MAHIDAGKTTTTERVLYYTGVNYKIGDKTSVGLGYRYLDAGDIQVTLGARLGGAPPTVSYDVESHSVLANINFQLGK